MRSRRRWLDDAASGAAAVTPIWCGRRACARCAGAAGVGCGGAGLAARAVRVWRSGAAALTLMAGLLAAAGVVRAGGNDLALENLCEPRPTSGLVGGTVAECGWLRRHPDTRLIESAELDGEAQARFRSLVSELGVVLAPRLVVPAETLGFAGFQLAAEIGVTSISRDRPFWNGVRRVEKQNPAAERPSPWLTTVGAYLRKGVWIGLPAVELGAGAMHLADSHLVAWQGYAKVALHEGHPSWPLPSLAVRGSGSYVTGTDQLRLTILGLDAVVSKPFGVRGTFRLEPFGGLSLLFIQAQSGRIDLTPGCDAFVARTAAAAAALGPGCAEAQRGTDNDVRANVAFPKQSVVRRQRLFFGLKARLTPLFLTAQFDLAPAGRSRDRNQPGGARDESGAQRTASLSAGLDF